MKIAVLTPLHRPICEPYFGGMEVHTALLVKELVRLGHDVTVYSRSDSIFEGVKLVPLTNSTFIYFPSIFLLDTFFRKLNGLRFDLIWRVALDRIEAEGFDLIINNDTFSKKAYTHRVKTPMLTVLHMPPVNYLVRAGKHKNARTSNKVYISVSHSMKKQWFDIPSKMVYNGIDVNFWNPKPNTLTKGAYAVWFGRLAPTKGVELAIEASKEANMPLKIIGPLSDGPRSDKSYFKNSVAPLLGEEVEYLGHLDHSDLRKIVQGAQVAVFTPLCEESFGLVVVEALACGTPVAVFSRGAFSELVTPKVGVLVEPENVQSLARALHQAKALNSKDCIEHAKNWSFVQMVEKYLAIGSDLIAQSKK